VSDELKELQELLRLKEEECETSRAAQAEADELAVLKAKLAHPLADLAVLRLQRHAPGLPTLVIARKPSSEAYKRWRDLLLKSKREMALRFMAGDCLEYPKPDVFASMAETFPELPDQVAMTGAELAKGGAEAEGK
jgi:hypothetical protein